PAGRAVRVVGRHPPAENDHLAVGGGGKLRDRGDVPARAPAPRLPPRDRAAETAGDRVVIAVLDEAAAGGEDVLEGAATDLDLEDPAVVPGAPGARLERVVVPERNLRGRADDRERGRVQSLVAD